MIINLRYFSRLVVAGEEGITVGDNEHIGASKCSVSAFGASGGASVGGSG